MPAFSSWPHIVVSMHLAICICMNICIFNSATDNVAGAILKAWGSREFRSRASRPHKLVNAQPACTLLLIVRILPPTESLQKCKHPRVIDSVCSNNLPSFSKTGFLQHSFTMYALWYYAKLSLENAVVYRFAKSSTNGASLPELSPAVVKQANLNCAPFSGIYIGKLYAQTTNVYYISQLGHTKITGAFARPYLCS